MDSKGPPLVVVDTDPGCDDALALFLMLAAERRGKLRLLAITCVRGNTSVDHGVRNTLRVLTCVERTDVPVYRGSAEPLIVDPQDNLLRSLDETPFHGQDGFGDAIFESDPDPSLVHKKSAVHKLTELAREHKGELNVVCLGPLTNIALAMKCDPDFFDNVKHFYIMGGNRHAVGNVTASAEFNFGCDPEAAHIVLSKARGNVTMVNVETGMNLGLPFEWRWEVLGQAGTEQSRLMNLIEKSVLAKSTEPKYLPHDSIIVAVLIRPSVVTKMASCHVTVELHGSRTRGQVVVDHLRRNPDNVWLVKDADQETLKQLLLFAVGHPDCTITV